MATTTAAASSNAIQIGAASGTGAIGPLTSGTGAPGTFNLALGEGANSQLSVIQRRIVQDYRQTMQVNWGNEQLRMNQYVSALEHGFKTYINTAIV